MQKKKYNRACALLSSAREKFPEHEIFGANGVDIKTALKAAFLAHCDAAHEVEAAEAAAAAAAASSQSQETAADSGESADALPALEKQKVVVSYLSDSVAFAVELNAALPTICMLLGSKQVRSTLNGAPYL